jgi:hypothetical protein
MVFEMAVGGDGLNHFGVGDPTAPPRLMDKHWRNSAQLQVPGIEVSALLDE